MLKFMAGENVFLIFLVTSVSSNDLLYHFEETKGGKSQIIREHQTRNKKCLLDWFVSFPFQGTKRPIYKMNKPLSSKWN